MITTNIVRQVDDVLLQDAEALYNKISKDRDKNNNHIYLPSLIFRNTMIVLEDLIAAIKKEKKRKEGKIKRYSNILDLTDIKEKDVRKTISVVLSYYDKRYYNDKRKKGWRIKVYALKNIEREVIQSIIKPFPNITMKDDIDVHGKDVVLITIKEV
jgi:hypothetical protein